MGKYTKQQRHEIYLSAEQFLKKRTVDEPAKDLLSPRLDSRLYDQCNDFKKGCQLAISKNEPIGFH